MYNYYAEHIKQLRKERQMTQKQFAEWLKIPLITITQWEQGKRTPPNYVYELIKYKCDHSINGYQIKIFD